MNAVEILKEAKSFIEGGFRKRGYASCEDSTGKQAACSPLYESATCFCSMGAIFRATGEHPTNLDKAEENEEYVKAYSTLAKHMRKHLTSTDKAYIDAANNKYTNFMTVTRANDNKETTQEQVVAAFDAAIKELTQ